MSQAQQLHYAVNYHCSSPKEILVLVGEGLVWSLFDVAAKLTAAATLSLRTRHPGGPKLDSNNMVFLTFIWSQLKCCK